MKKKLLTLIFITSGFFASSCLALGYKVCLFHDTEYAYIPQLSMCPWNSNNLPPDAEQHFPPGPHHNAHAGTSGNSGHIKKGKDNNSLMTVIVHSPECFGEHNGGMN